MNDSRQTTRPRLALVLIACSVLLVGCETSPTNESMGTVVGGVLGGVLGSVVGDGSGQKLAIIGGVVLGGLVGRTVGRYMDANDQRKFGESLDHTPTGETSAWRNAETGNEFQMTPVRDYQSEEGHPCRDFVQNVIVDGELKSVEGSACKEPENDAWMST